VQRLFGVVRDGAGNALATVTVQVLLKGTATPATIFSDNVGTVLANPFTNNADGTYQFYAANGRYDIVLTKAGFGEPLTDTADNVLDDNCTIISPTQLTVNTNDYAPTNGFTAAIWRISSSGAINITGVLAPTSASSGYQLVIVNVGSQNITFTNNDGSSQAANRILMKGGGNVVLGANNMITIFYDSVTAVWRQSA
jgi:hypothetical protein